MLPKMHKSHEFFLTATHPLAPPRGTAAQKFVGRGHSELITMKLIVSLLAVLCTSAVAVSNAEVQSGNLRKLEGKVVPGSAISSNNLEEDKCTTIAVGPKAGIDGPMTTHTADCADCDFRISKVLRDTNEFSNNSVYLLRLFVNT